MKSRLVSVTGATGFLGLHTVEAFRREGWRVRAIVRPGRRRALPAGVEIREAALSAADLPPAIDGSDVIVHAAGLTRAADNSAFERVNVGGTGAVVEAANACRARLVHVSSQAAIGTGTIERPAREDDPARPINAYGRSKLGSERVLRDRAEVPWVIVRPSAVYGPGDRQFLSLLRLARRGIFPLVGPPDWAVTLAYVEDVARAIVLSAEAEAVSGTALFIGHPEPNRPDGVLRALADLLGRPYRPRRVPGPLARMVARIGDVSWKVGHRPMLDSARLQELDAEGFVCAVERARDMLGFAAAVPLAEGLDRTIRWYRAQGWL
jgi:nucleoside-diphosphate-sugar epimerase